MSSRFRFNQLINWCPAQIWIGTYCTYGRCKVYVSSRSCANFALRQAAEDNPHCRQQVTDTIIKNCMWMIVSHLCPQFRKLCSWHQTLLNCSQAVLKHIANESARFHTFVANRFSVIRESTDVQQWRCIYSKHNPSDDASRGLRVKKFMENRCWIHADWTKNHGSQPQNDPEVKGCTVVCNKCV